MAHGIARPRSCVGAAFDEREDARGRLGRAARLERRDHEHRARLGDAGEVEVLDDELVGVLSNVSEFSLPDSSLCRSKADGTLVSRLLEDTPVLESMMCVSIRTLLSAEESAFVASAV